MTQAISNAFYSFCETSYTHTILKNDRLINFRNGDWDTEFLERCGRSLVVEPVFLVVSLCAIVETIVKLVLLCIASIAANFSPARLEEGSAKTLLTKSGIEGFMATLVGIDWVVKNLFAAKLDFDEDLEKIGDFAVVSLECTGLDNVFRHIFE